jgi:UDP-N-acetyl-D-glucosamine dehydrogenase
MLDTPSSGERAGQPSISPEAERIAHLPVVCVQGLGFVGGAVAVAIASARDDIGRPRYSVIGVDLPTADGLERIEALQRGVFPFPTTDSALSLQAKAAHAAGNLRACADASAFSLAEVILVDVPLDVISSDHGQALDFKGFQAAVATVGEHMQADALVIIETTVPPGTTSRVVGPILKEQLVKRGEPLGQFRLAHCYERVTPGPGYLDSILKMPRVFAGVDRQSEIACEAFFKTILDFNQAALARASSTTASELAKVLENTYRATTIALMEEFAEFAEKAGVDLFEVVELIRMRPTHSNVRTPGFGVGGYCLTKDPLMAGLAARDLFGFEQAFPFASLAVSVNQNAPKRALGRLRQLLGGDLAGCRLLLLGASYRDGVADTRRSPSQIFVEAAAAEDAEVFVHDPLVEYWRELSLPVPRDLPPADGLDAVVLAVPHAEYRNFDFVSWLGRARPVFLDAFDVLSTDTRKALRAMGCRVESIGRGSDL